MSTLACSLYFKKEGTTERRKENFMIANIIVGVVIVLIIAGAIGYIVKAKKSGVKCIGCAAGKNCSSGHNDKSGGCGCS